MHLLFLPEDTDPVEKIKRFLLELDFSYQGGPYRCQRSDLIRLGRAHQPSLTEDGAARSEGANQFKVKLDQFMEAWAKNDWMKNNALIAVAGGEKDGTSGLRDAAAPFVAQRKHVERIAHIVFSANPQQINFWLGKGPASVVNLKTSTMASSLAWTVPMRIHQQKSDNLTRTGFAGSRETSRSRSNSGCRLRSFSASSTCHSNSWINFVRQRV
jgi:hypothetical protein